MKVAVIIPVRGKAVYLKKCLDSIFNLNYKDLEIIVVDDGIDNNSKNILDNFKDKIKILNSNFKGPSFARNLAAKSTDAEFIAFIDSDCIAHKDWINELLLGFEKFPFAVSCGGAQYLPDDSNSFEKRVFLFMEKANFISDYAHSFKDIVKVSHNPSYNVMYKRECFLKEGGFKEGLWPAEDVEFDWRLIKKGYTLIFNPKAIVYHYKPKNLKDFLKMMYRYGFSQGYLVKMYGFFRKIHFVPLLFFGIFIISIIFFFYKAYLYIFLLGLFFLLILLFIFPVKILNIAVLGFLFWNFGFLRGLFLKIK